MSITQSKLTMADIELISRITLLNIQKLCKMPRTIILYSVYLFLVFTLSGA